jgi:predicted O-methyltransferase YrrM
VPTDEPKTAEEVRAWISRSLQRRDPFANVFEQSLEHRASHDCDTYPSFSARTVAVLAAASHARRILEIGCGLGYSALWLARGVPDASIETVEKAPEHAALAGENFRENHVDGRVLIHEGVEESPVPAAGDL